MPLMVIGRYRFCKKHVFLFYFLKPMLRARQVSDRTVCDANGEMQVSVKPACFDVCRKGGRKRGFLPERLKLFKDFACVGPRIERSTGSNPDFSTAAVAPNPFSSLSLVLLLIIDNFCILLFSGIRMVKVEVQCILRLNHVVDLTTG